MSPLANEGLLVVRISGLPHIQITSALVDPGGATGAPPPQQDQILSFSHTFLPKSAHVGGRRPLPPAGNPGSATEVYLCLRTLITIYVSSVLNSYIYCNIPKCEPKKQFQPTNSQIFLLYMRTQYYD